VCCTPQHSAGVADGVVVKLAHYGPQPAGAVSTVVAASNSSQHHEGQGKVTALGAAPVPAGGQASTTPLM
jgi:hypothetical protein